MKTGANIYYYHTDHLGSSSVMTDTNGNKVEDLYYYPYGKVYTDTGSIKVKHKFTGQEFDSETGVGLYNYGARYYEPEIGRFISADSIVQDYTDPQTLNRYSYCRNNPVIYTDPSGHLFIIDDIIIAAATYVAANAAVIAEGAAIGAAIGGAQAAVTGGNIGMGMLTGAVSGALFAGVAHPISAGLDLGAKAMVHAATGAIAGGINMAITGGNLSSNMFKGAVTSGFGTASSGVIPDEFGYQLAGRAAVGGLIGGGIASSQGGDFWNGFAKGAASAATAYLCNDMRDELKEMYKALKFSACGVTEISKYTFKWVGKHAILNFGLLAVEYLTGYELSLAQEGAYKAATLLQTANHALNETEEEIKDLAKQIENCKKSAGIQ